MMGPRRGLRLFALWGLAASLVLGAPGESGAREKRRRSKRAATHLPAAPAAQEPEPINPVARARAREELTQARATATVARARAQALIAYRLARRRGSELLGDPARRAETARALDAALLVLKRSTFEKSALERELVLARAERSSLEGGAPRPAPTLSIDHSDGWPFALPTASLVWPARGTLVGGPGLRRDPATGTEAVFEGIELLSRMNEPARAVADGRVERVAALPQGGHAVVLSHSEDRISILSGLRQVDVSAGAEVKSGQTIGVVGRDLDGAPVLAFELWQAGRPLDPRPFLPGR